VDNLANIRRPKVGRCLSSAAKPLLQLAGVELVSEILRVAFSGEVDLSLGRSFEEDGDGIEEYALAPGHVDVEALM